MSCKVFVVLCAIICVVGSLEAASLWRAAEKSNAVFQKLDYEGVEANVRNARQTNAADDSGEDSDEDDDDDEDEDEAELQHQSVVKRQQASEQSLNAVEKTGNEDSEDNFEEDDDDDTDDDDNKDYDYFGRRLRRDVSAAISNNVEGNSKPTKRPTVTTGSTDASSTSNSDSSNTSVLILIRDTIKKVTELPNTQQVTTSAQQYFQLFEHFLQQTIEQVIGADDDEDGDEDENENENENEKEEEEGVASTTFIPEDEFETATNANSVKLDKNETSDKEKSSVESEITTLQPEKRPENVNEV